jgi:hypothetical protein
LLIGSRNIVPQEVLEMKKNPAERVGTVQHLVGAFPERNHPSPKHSLNATIFN